MAGTQMYAPGRRPGMNRPQQPGMGGLLLKATLLLVVVVVAVGGIWYWVAASAPATPPVPESLFKRAKAARNAWIVADKALQQAKLDNKDLQSCQDAVTQATNEWAQAEAALQEKIAERRAAWLTVHAELQKSGFPPEQQAQLEQIEKDLKDLGSTPELPEPPPRYRTGEKSAKYREPFNYTHAKTGELTFSAPRAASSVGATAGIVVDLNTRNVLWSKNPDKSVPIASMVKMMTMLLAMEGLEENPQWNLDTPVQVTAIATRVPRTGVIDLDTREQLPFSDLMKAIAIKSANDAAYQIAEFVGKGDADQFIARMNSRAQELGMVNTRFINPCGLTANRDNSQSSPADMARLGEELLRYPLVMEYTSMQHTTIPRKLTKAGYTDLTTTNKLVNPRWPGVDGLKTGFIKQSGYCVTVSCLRGGRRIIAVVTGYESGIERDRFCRQLLDWAYARAAELETAQQ